MNNYFKLAPLCCAAAAIQGVEAKNTQSNKPNLIVIMCDDLGYEDVSFNIVNRAPNEINTPNIDRIANEGVKFTSGYTTYSVSSPSRAGFMTGRYGQRFGYERNPQYRPNELVSGLPLDETTIAESLRDVGYKSGIIGKWHLGAHIDNHPCNRGFDEFFGHLGGGHKYFPEDLDMGDSYKARNEGESYRTDIMRNHNHVKIKKYLTKEFSDEAVSFVTRHKDEPFFLFLSYNAPHTPLQAPQEYIDRYAHIKDVNKRTYAAMVSVVDEGVGMLLDRLKELKLDDNTIIFFLSDNGGPEGKSGASNGVLREGKSSVFDGGFRVPFAMRWSSQVKPQVYDKPISSLDIFATISDLTSSKSNNPLDGVNLIPYVTGKNKNYPHDVIYLRKYDQNRYAARCKEFKLVRLPKDKDNIRGSEYSVKLFNIEKNMSEAESDGRNLTQSMPKKVAEIEAKLDDWERGLIEPKFDGLMMK